MLEKGLEHEAKMLYESGALDSKTASQAIAYKEIVPFFKGEMSLEECVEILKRNSRRYAKRQLTWFKRWEGAHWIEWEAQADFELARLSSTKFLAARGYHDVANTL